MQHYNPNQRRDKTGKWTDGFVNHRALNAVQGEQEAQEQALIDFVKKNPKLPGEADKAYAKRVIDHIPSPERLPEEMGLYFNTDKGEIVSLEDLVPAKAAEETITSGDNASKRMWGASKGLLSKRDPISVKKEGDKYKILDGNSTYTAAKKYGWEKLIVQIQN